MERCRRLSKGHRDYGFPHRQLTQILDVRPNRCASASSNWSKILAEGIPSPPSTLPLEINPLIRHMASIGKGPCRPHSGEAL